MNSRKEFAKQTLDITETYRKEQKEIFMNDFNNGNGRHKPDKNSRVF